MKVLSEKINIINFPDKNEVYNRINGAATVCYQSYHNGAECIEKFVKKLVKMGHHSVLEHVNITVAIICDRGVSHELVRHRLASYSQESTRYCNYASEGFGEEIAVIRPIFYDEGSQAYEAWYAAMQHCEAAYLGLIETGSSPQEARSVLPTSLKTEIVITANLQEWRHIFNVRCKPAAHPQMRFVMNKLLKEFKERCPLVFEDIVGE